jgi:hypothetical protein
MQSKEEAFTSVLVPDFPKSEKMSIFPMVHIHCLQDVICMKLHMPNAVRKANGIKERKGEKIKKFY